MIFGINIFLKVSDKVDESDFNAIINESVFNNGIVRDLSLHISEHFSLSEKEATEQIKAIKRQFKELKKEFRKKYGLFCIKTSMLSIWSNKSNITLGLEL